MRHVPLLLALAGPAFAQPTPETPAPAPTPAAAPAPETAAPAPSPAPATAAPFAPPVTAGPCTPPDPITAEVNAGEGVRLAKDERFDEAAALFRIAGRLDPCTPRYPFLLGRALERQGQLDAAEAAYQTVIDRFPTSVEFTRAQGAIAELRVARAKADEEARLALARQAAGAEAARRAAVQPAVPAAVVAVQPATSGAGGTVGGGREVRSGGSALSWTAIGAGTMGVGALAATVGLVGALAAQSTDDELTLAAKRPDRARYDALVIDRDDYTMMSYVGYGVGGALLVGGLVMLLVPDDDMTATVLPAAGGAVLGLGGLFE